MLALRINAADQLRQHHVAVACDLLQRIPELIFETPLELRPARTIERLTISDFMMVPASCGGIMVPKGGSSWQGDTKQ